MTKWLAGKNISNVANQRRDEPIIPGSESLQIIVAPRAAHSGQGMNQVYDGK